jgi:hypothetical protein
MRFARSLAAILLILPAGCGASASISSVRDSSAGARFGRLYVAVDQGNVDPEFAQALNHALDAQLQLRGVTVKTRILSGLDLDENALDADVKAWRPDGLLVVNFAGGSGTYGSIENATYNVSLVEVASGRRIWRAQVSSHRAFGSSTGMMEETASCVGERLAQDHLIGSR